MNDRFKFRVWNKEERIMHYNAECTYDGMSGTPILMHDSFGGLLDDDNYIVEQCTGLKDKNGKLIYEGDVLNVEDYDGSHTMMVAWHDRASCLSLLKQKAGKYAPIWRHLIAFISDELEIIGNVHEMEVEQ